MQVSLVHNYEVVEALASDRSDQRSTKPFGQGAVGGLDHIAVVGQEHLRHILMSYIEYDITPHRTMSALPLKSGHSLTRGQRRIYPGIF